MKRAGAAAILVLSGAASLPVLGTHLAVGQEKTASATWALYVPSEIAWKPGPDSLPPGVKVAVLEGDSAKAGFFTMRLLMPDGYKVAPHWHPTIERLTIISRDRAPRNRRSIRCDGDEGASRRDVQLDASEDDTLRVDDRRDGPAAQQHRPLASRLRGSCR